MFELVCGIVCIVLSICVALDLGLDCSDALVFNRSNSFFECLDSLDCVYCLLDLLGPFALCVFFDGLDLLCDAKLPYLFIRLIGFVWTVCIVSVVM